MSDIYVTINLNEFGEGQGNSDRIVTGSEGFFVIAFVDTLVEKEEIHVEVRKKGEAKPVASSSARTAGFHVTYGIPVKPLPQGTYDLNVSYGGSTFKKELIIENNDVISYSEEFIYPGTLIPSGRSYSIYSDKKDTAFRNDVTGEQTLNVEVSTTSRNWFRLKWIYVNRRASGDLRGKDWVMIKEHNVYLQDINGDKGFLRAKIDVAKESWFTGTYRVELYQDVYNEPVDVMFVDILPSGNTNKAAAEDPTSESDGLSPDTNQTPSQPTEVTPQTPSQTVEVTPNTPTPTSDHESAAVENKVFMTSGLGSDGRNIDVVTSFPAGIKTPLYAVAVTDYPEGTTLSFGMKHSVIGNLTNAADVIKGPAIDGMYYTLVSFKLYNPETDNWPPGSYQVVLYVNGEPVTQSNFEISGD
ncbi:MAG: hypothetical protein PHV32_12920 [Eubacteriales bacterium]|nr:hypothetical protein [Eubacteriales bacterium]